MRPQLGAGLVAGAVGTLALDAVSYADIAWRGRPPSELPAETLHAMLHRRAGVEHDARDRNRELGLAALGGYSVGLAIGAAYGLLAPVVTRLPLWARAVAVGGAALVAGNAGPVLNGITNPREWGVAGWAADIAPHAAYGLATVVTFDVVVRSRGER
jgi:hypothetical protein